MESSTNGSKRKHLQEMVPLSSQNDGYLDDEDFALDQLSDHGDLEANDEELTHVVVETSKDRIFSKRGLALVCMIPLMLGIMALGIAIFNFIDTNQNKSNSLSVTDTDEAINVNDNLPSKQDVWINNEPEKTNPDDETAFSDWTDLDTPRSADEPVEEGDDYYTQDEVVVPTNTINDITDSNEEDFSWAEEEIINEETNDNDKPKINDYYDGNYDSSETHSTTGDSSPELTSSSSFKILSVIPHDSSSFTQGLSLFDGVLYESTGMYGRSKVRKIDPDTGAVLKSVDMEPRFFGEGLTSVQQKSGHEALVQITWTSGIGFVYDPTSLETLYNFTIDSYNGEGWGITYMPETNELVVSDGSEYLTFWDASDNIRQPRKTFSQSRDRLQVLTNEDVPVTQLNELEYVRGWILANVWLTNTLAKIDPTTGHIDTMLDMTELWPPNKRDATADVLNGISVVQIQDNLGIKDFDREFVEVYLTGKQWPSIYRVLLNDFVPLPPPTRVSKPSATTNNAQDSDENNQEKHDQTDENDFDGTTSSEIKVCPTDGPCYVIIREIPHDPSSFTQGLTYADGVLYESTGLYGQSKIRQLDPNTGAVLNNVQINKKIFGEGMTYMDTSSEDGPVLVQITWKAKKGFVYRADTLEQIREFSYETKTSEGWGITYLPLENELIVSDGSEWLHFWRATADENGNFPELRRIQVRYPETNKYATKLNELELADNGLLLANVWYENIILAIDPKTGDVVTVYDFVDLWPKALRSKDADCLNGISVTGTPGELYITGKKWPTIYHVAMLDM